MIHFILGLARAWSKEKIMVQVKEAVQQAQKYLPEIFESAAGNELLLEGVELTDDSKLWTVTFSYFSRKPGQVFDSLREYKTIKLRAEDGQFVGARNGVL
jgi:hypothetical protein